MYDHVNNADTSPGTLVCCCHRSWWSSSGVTLNRERQIQVGRLESATFDQCLAMSQRRCKIWTYLLWSATKNSYRMVPLPVSLSNPWLPQTTLFSTFCVAFHKPEEIETWNFVHRLNTASASPRCRITPKRGVVRVTWRILNFWNPNYLLNGWS